MRSGSLMKPMITAHPSSIKPTLINLREKRFGLITEFPRRWSHVHYTYQMIESRVLLLLRLFDKIDPNSVKLDLTIYSRSCS